MPLYLTCPHCDHPMLLAPKWRGRSRLCRQSGSAVLVAPRQCQQPLGGRADGVGH